MTTELKDAMAELEADLERGEYSGGGYRYIEADPEALRTVLAHLSTPPADDVREALIDAMIDVEVSGGMVEFGKDDRAEAAYLADAILAAPGIEVRPRGTVTAEAREAEMRELHHFEVEQQLAETIAIVKRAQAVVLRHEHTPASLHMEDILNEVNTEIPSAAEVRPRGTVTDTTPPADDVRGVCDQCGNPFAEHYCAPIPSCVHLPAAEHDREALIAVFERTPGDEPGPEDEHESAPGAYHRMWEEHMADAVINAGFARHRGATTPPADDVREALANAPFRGDGLRLPVGLGRQQPRATHA